MSYVSCVGSVTQYAALAFLVLNPGTKNYLVIILFVTVQLYLPHHNPLFYPRAWSFPVLKGTFLKNKFKMSTCDMRHAT
jgi:hypothetical protein